MSYFDDASLVMIPSGYKASKVYSVKPTDGTGDLTFTRALDTATRVGPDGLIEKVRTNLATYSNAFSDGSWAKITDGTFTLATESITDAFGNTSAVFKVTLLTGSFLVIRKTLASATTQPTNFSLYVKKTISSSFVAIDIDDNTDVVSGANTNWQRISNTRATASLVDITTYSVGEPFYIFASQVELGDIATPYIPTTTAAVSVGMLANVPRLDYLGGGCGKLILEPQRTNLTQYSEQLNNAYWNKAGSTASANVAVSPDGFTNADLLTESATTADHAFYDIVAYFVSGTTYTLSFFAKANGRTKVEVLSANSNTCPKGRFDLVAQTAVGTDGSFGAKIESYGNGWFRCSVSRVAPNTGLDVPYHAMVQSFGTISYAGNGTSGVFFYGMQTEVGSYATSYIPTLGAAVTRSADAASKTGISALIGQTEGTIFFEINSSNFESYTQRIFSISDDTNDNAIGFQLTGANEINYYVEVGGVLSALITKTAPAITLGQNVKVAAAYKANDFVLYVGGVQVGTDSSGGVPATSVLRYANPTGNAPYIGKVVQTLLFKTRLSNAALAELTA